MYYFIKNNFKLYCLQLPINIKMMKQTQRILTLLLILFSLTIISGCDSPSGSKPDAVTKPILTSPADNATNIPLTATFTWTSAADLLEIAVNPNFTPVLHSADVSGQSYRVPSGILQKNKRYYWHAGKKSGNDIYWSDDKFSFVTVP
jgi:hypothetical protein